MKHYWAAIGKDGVILEVGLTTHRFDRRCFPFSVQGYMHWVSAGARYAELFVPSLKGIKGSNIKDVVHGRVRKTTDVLVREAQ